MTVYTYEVKVQDVSGSNKFFLDGYQTPTLGLGHDITYRFDVSDSSNSGHLFQFSTTSDGTHGSGTAFGSGDGYTTSGTAGSSGAYVELAVTSSTAGTTYYFCATSGHTAMGGTAVTTSAEYIDSTGVALRKPILGNSDSWGHFVNQNLDTISGKLPQSFTFPTGTGDDRQTITSDGSGGTTWEDVALTPEITGVAWYSDSGYSSVLSASEAINIDDATYLKVTGVNFGSSTDFNSTAYVQIVNTTQASAIVGNNQSGLTGCVTSASHQGTTEWRFTINPSGVGSISSGDTLKVKAVTSGGTHQFATGYVISADPTLVTMVGESTISNTASVGSYGGAVAGGGATEGTKLLLNFDRGNESTDFEDSSNIGGNGHKVTADNDAEISTTVGAFNGTSSGKTNNTSAYFDGSGDHLDVSNDILSNIWDETGSQHFTLDCWVRKPSGSGSANIWGTTAHSGGYGFGLGFHYDSGVYGGFKNCKFGWSNTSALVLTFNSNQWYHCLWHVYWATNSPKCDFFFDGVYKGRTTYSSSTSAELVIGNYTDTAGSSNLYAVIGGSVSSTGADGDHWTGYIDSFRICKGDTTKVSGDPLYFSTAWDSKTVGTAYFTPPTKIYGATVSDTIDTVTLTGTPSDGGGYVTFNNATLSTDGNNTETDSSLPSGLTLNETEDANQTATITGDLTASAGSHAINLVARATSDGTDANIDPNRKTAYSHTITKDAGGPPVLFNARRYVGNADPAYKSGYGFQPDMIWVKGRSVAEHGIICDSVRGSTLRMYSNQTTGETSGGATSFNPDGFTTSDGNGSDSQDNATYIAWGWKAGGEPSGNDKQIRDGTETSLTSGSTGDYYRISEVKQSVNVNGDFSITRYKGSTGGSNDTFFKHGLSGEPDFTILKRTDGSDNWICWHKDGDSGNTGGGDFLTLNKDDRWGYWNGSSSTNNFFGSNGLTLTHYYLPDGSSSANDANQYFICYAWKAVDGVSAFGTYTGGDSDDRTVTLGWEPRFVMVKRTDTSGSWHMFDTFRGVSERYLLANSAGAESTGTANRDITINSTGFVAGTDGNVGGDEGEGGTSNKFIYVAFA